MARQRIEISVERLRELFELRADGALVYRMDCGKARKGSRAGYARKDGYWIVCVDYRKLLAHRVVFVLVHGRWPTYDVDHRDGVPGNDAPDNLREATHAQNQKNRRNRNKNNTSGVLGVVWDKARGLWAVQVSFREKNKHYGRWDSLEFAELVAQEARKKLFGAFAPEN